MDGITFLATNSIYMEPSIYAEIGVIFGICGTVGFLIGAFMLFAEDQTGSFIFGIVAIVCFMLAIISGNAIERRASTFSHYEYKVLIDDSVSLNEFNEKYEILNQEGQIYTVIEREVEK